MFISFQRFTSIEQAKEFAVFNATPEREDGALGVLPNGELVYAKYSWDEDNEVEWVTADL